MRDGRYRPALFHSTFETNICMKKAPNFRASGIYCFAVHKPRLRHWKCKHNRHEGVTPMTTNHRTKSPPSHPFAQLENKLGRAKFSLANGEPLIGAGRRCSRAACFAAAQCVGRREVTVAAHHDLDRGPVATDATDDVTQDLLDFLARWPLAGAQQRQHGPAGRRLEDLDRLEAVDPAMGAEQCKVLLSLHSTVSVVNVEHDAARHALKASTEQIDQFKPHARKLAPEWGILQARERRLRH